MRQYTLKFDDTINEMYYDQRNTPTSEESNKDFTFTSFSQRILEDFNSDPQLVMCNFPDIYHSIVRNLPDEKVSFKHLDMESSIACEVISSSICHKMNWDFLRDAILNRTASNIKWLKPKNLKSITIINIENMLKDYPDKDRIRAAERSQILREIGNYLFCNEMFFRDLFFDNNGPKNYLEIIENLKQLVAFSQDPAEKKMQLLIQKISRYESLDFLGNYCKPAVDYHLIRLF